MENRQLYVRMLGDFQMTWCGEPLNFKVGSSTKIMQFLQIILLRGEKGITREQLVKYLYEDYAISDPANSLRVMHYRLRQILVESGLPKCNYIQITGGSYHWNYEIPLQTDAGEFEMLLNKAELSGNPWESMELRKEACRLFKGILLPMLGAEEWVISEGAYYKKTYIKNLKKILAELEQQGGYDEMLEFSSQAVRIFPYEEWQLPQIGSLIGLGQYDRALEIYNQTSRLYMNDLGVSPSRQMRELYRTISEKIGGTTGSLEDIRTQIQEQSMDTGAFYCNLLSFVDTSRILSRIAERSNKEMSLMLCTLKTTDGDIRKRQRRIEVEMQALKAIIQRSLRKGDFYTKYSPCQFLIFLTGTARDNCVIVSDRIEESFISEFSSGKTELLFSMTNMREIEQHLSDIQNEEE